LWNTNKMGLQCCCVKWALAWVLLSTSYAEQAFFSSKYLRPCLFPGIHFPGNHFPNFPVFVCH
jgi:hypothetical protein